MPPLNGNVNYNTSIQGTARFGFDPVSFRHQFRRRFQYSTIMRMVTNNDFAGEFVGKGTTIEVPIEPLIATTRRRQGDPVRYQRVHGTTEQFKIGRQSYIAFQMDTEEQKFSAIPDLAGQFMNFGRNQRLPMLEMEYFSDIHSKSDVFNQGNVAGRRSGMFRLGEAVAPVQLFKTTAEMNAATGTGQKQVAPDYFANLMNVLREQPGHEALDPFIIIPVIVGDKLQTSELKQADLTNDDISIIRKDIKYIGNISGARVYVSNLLPIIPADTDNNLPQRYVCLCGDSSAVTYWNEPGELEMNLRNTAMRGTFHRIFFDYEWFMRYPERQATGIVTL